MSFCLCFGYGLYRAGPKHAPAHDRAESEYRAYLRVPSSPVEPEPLAKGEPRAELLRAHHYRRAENWPNALADYAALSWTHPAEDVREQALRWQARTLELAGEESQALPQWQSLAARAYDPALRVQAFDRIALALARAGKQDAARAVLLRAHAALAPRAAEHSESGRRIATLLKEMRAARLLQCLDWPPPFPSTRPPKAALRSKKNGAEANGCFQTQGE